MSVRPISLLSTPPLSTTPLPRCETARGREGCDGCDSCDGSRRLERPARPRPPAPSHVLLQYFSYLLLTEAIPLSSPLSAGSSPLILHTPQQQRRRRRRPRWSSSASPRSWLSTSLRSWFASSTLPSCRVRSPRPRPRPRQGLTTLVHFLAQRKHILLDTLGASTPPSRLDRGTREGVPKTAQVELKSGRV